MLTQVSLPVCSVDDERQPPTARCPPTQTIATGANVKTTSAHLCNRGLAFFLCADIFDGGGDRRPQQSDVCRWKMDARRAALSPHTGTWSEHAWRFPSKRPLLRCRQLHHSMFVVGIAERSKNLSAKPKIGVAHVRRLRRAWNGQGNASELFCGHGVIFSANGPHQRPRATGEVCRLDELAESAACGG